MRKELCGIKAVTIGVALGVLSIGAAWAAAPAPQPSGHKPEAFQLARKEKRANKEERREVRKERSRPVALDFDLKRSQPIFVKAFDTSEAVIENAKSMSDDEAKRQKKIPADLLQKRMVDKLMAFRFDAKPYPEDAGKANVKDALVIDGTIGKLTFSRDDTFCAIKVRVCPQDEPKKILGEYEDGGTTEDLANRVGRRFDATAKD